MPSAWVNGSPKLATSTPISFNLVDMSKPENVRRRAREVRRGDVGHLVPGRNQAVNHPAMPRNLADREDVRIGCL